LTGGPGHESSEKVEHAWKYRDIFQPSLSIKGYFNTTIRCAVYWVCQIGSSRQILNSIRKQKIVIRRAPYSLLHRKMYEPCRLIVSGRLLPSFYLLLHISTVLLQNYYLQVFFFLHIIIRGYVSFIVSFIPQTKPHM
jgi:hypothetical protein